MRICLLSLTYPPASTDGIPRQRQILATALARLQHDVHVVTCGPITKTRREAGVAIHEVAVEPREHYHDQYVGLDDALTRSQRLFEGLVAQARLQPFDIVDVPMWMAQGFVTLHRYPGPTVMWLQTTYAQLLAINKQQRTPLDEAVIDLESACLERANGILGDSQVAFETIHLHYHVNLQGRSDFAHIGIPPLLEQQERTPHSQIELLVVGRLELRKGTPLLLNILPALLRKQANLVVRFVGRDNSTSDGWQARYRAGYAEVFRQLHPDLSNRVIFEGYVDDDTLQRRYQEADALLVPSVYESFGIIYLEAMRVGLPIITFAAGGATEIFAAGEQDGAILVMPGDRNRLMSAIQRIANDRALCMRLGAAGKQRFLAAFTDTAMATATLAHYGQVIKAYDEHRDSVSLIYQVAAALYIGDAVSTIALRNARILGELGHPPVVLTPEHPKSLQGQADVLERVFDHKRCGLIMHYAGYNTAVWMLDALRGRKAVHYHNSTPASFFAIGSEMYDHQRLGYAQLREIADRFDLIIGDTAYNVAEFACYTTVVRPALVLYPIVDPIALQDAPYDLELHAALQAEPGLKIVFAGRIAPNKRQDRLMQLLEHYCNTYDSQAQLWLVGDQSFDPVYLATLETLRSTLRYGDQVHLVGKVPDASLYAYYRAADVFLCASEHEGFCVPIAEAMAFDLPVIAYASSAVPETMGGAGILVEAWDIEQIAADIQRLVADHAVQQQLILKQRSVLGRFSADEARDRLAAIVRFLERGEHSRLFFETRV